MLKSVLFLISSSAFATAVQFDPPDLNFEYKLHQQYVQTQSRGEAAQVGWLESYQLQTGESLWDLSRMLYGDGNYWPKVWAQNQNITNPHLIRKGHTLQFLMGSEDEAPSFRFSEDGDSGVELAAASVATNPQIQIPSPESEPRPILKLPNSFPVWQEVYRKRPDRYGIDTSHIQAIDRKVAERIPLSAFVQETPIQSLGSFLEVEKESGLPVPMQYVYVKVKKGVGHPGMKMLIVQDHGPLKKVNSQVEGTIDARFIQIFGDIELSEIAQPNFTQKADMQEFEIYRALLLHAMSLSLTKYDLIEGAAEWADLSANGPSATTVGQVIGSMKHEASALYGPGDIVFLNKGSREGLASGQLMDVFIDRSIRDERTPVTYPAVSSGVVKIVKVSNTCATGVILSAVDSVQQGDRVQQHTASGRGTIESSLSGGSGTEVDPIQDPGEPSESSEF